MKNYYFLFLFIASTFNCFSQGLIFDKASFNKAPEFQIERGLLPDKYSLENYLPILYPQSGSTCVAMSFALARTIIYAKTNKLIEKNKITAYQMSPYFIYYMARNKNDYTCKGGLNVMDAAEVAKKYGFNYMYNVEYPDYFPFTASFLCPADKEFYPPVLEEHLKKAKVNKVNEVYISKSIDGIKYALSLGIPVIIAMQIPKSFESLKTEIWNPLKTENKSNKIGGHAVVAIGYNDDLYGGAVRIANSWGEEWGDKGKAWIRYSDLAKWLDGALILDVSTKYNTESPESIIKNTPPILKTNSFKLKQITKTVLFDNAEFINSFKSGIDQNN